MKRAWLLLPIAACLGRESAAPESREELASGAQPIAAPAAPPPPPAAAEPAPQRSGAADAEKSAREAQEADEPRGEPAEPAAETSRSWFPETFLFEPLVVTDDSGAAKVAVRVPDRLTTWRVLALAHSRAGAQAGMTTSFLGTLDAYVDPVLPPFLYAGDEVRLPVQVVNTSETALAGELRLGAENAAVTPARAPVAVAPGGSSIVTAILRPGRAGQVTLRAALGDTDAVLRSFPVLPYGRPVTRSYGGTLAAPRKLTLDTPAGADPASAEVRLAIYPGALGILRTELSGSAARGGVADDAYTLSLAGNAARLLAAFGDEVNPTAVRELSLVAAQRVVRHARTLDPARATLLAGAALAHPDNAVLARLGERALDHLATQQRPDGTIGGADGWTLPRLLVSTAEGVRVLRATAKTPEAQQRAARVGLRAAGAIERNLGRVDDGYTAAAILAAGLAGESAAALRDKVRDAVEHKEDGTRVLVAAEEAQRSDGAAPSSIEASALAVLALADSPDDQALVADLGAAVLGAYRPSGWGDGRENLVCLEAVLRLFSTPVPEGVKIVLAQDGKVVSEGVLDKARLREVLSLSAPALPGRHEWTLEATPAVPGLAYSLTQVSYLPWEAPAGPRGGMELSVTTRGELRAGRPVDVVVRAVAPAGRELRIRQGLPAGVQVDAASLDRLVAAGALRSWNAADGSVELIAPELEPGAVLSVQFRVVPTLGGTLRSGPATLHAAGSDAGVELPPAVWRIS
jgi:hypothetical protein